MPRRIAVYGATDDALALLPALARRSDLELAWVYDPDARALRRRLAWIEPGAARLLHRTLTDDPRVPARIEGLALVVDGGLPTPSPPPAGAVPPAEAGARLGLAPAAWHDPPPLETGPGPAPAQPLALAQAVAEGRRFALLRCDAAVPDGDDVPLPARELARRVRRRAAEALRDALAPGERLEQAGDGALLALLPLAPGADPDVRLVRLVRAAAEQVAKELGDAPLRTPLIFGYAVHPDEADGAEALLARACRSRIRML